MSSFEVYACVSVYEEKKEYLFKVIDQRRRGGEGGGIGAAQLTLGTTKEEC